jgi:phosphofructokinase-like protein
MGKTKHILVCTSGGDAPGLNAVIHSVVSVAQRRGHKTTGIKNGFDGLLMEGTSGLIPLDRKVVSGISHLGGTILGTKNHGHPFEYPMIENGKTVFKDRSDEAVARFNALKADALIVIGGDGSLKLAHRFFEKGIPIVGVPKTIDNDILGTYPSFGFDTAVMVATEAIDRLHTTAQAHERVMVVEVMGRYAGWIALYAGIAGGADVILIPEIDYDLESVCQKVRERDQNGIPFSIIVAAEGAKPIGGKYSLKSSKSGAMEKLGGIAEKLAFDIENHMNKAARHVVLGHLQRGGGPSPRDRLLALRLGVKAVDMVEEGLFDFMCAATPPGLSSIPLKHVITGLKTVEPNSDLLSSARSLGISFGNL